MPVATEQQLHVRVTCDGGCAVVEAHGEVDEQTAPRLRTILRSMAGDPNSLLVLDLRPTSFLGNPGIRALLDAYGSVPAALAAFEVQVRAGSQPEQALHEAGVCRRFSVIVWKGPLEGPVQEGQARTGGSLELRIPADVFQVSRVRRLTEQVLLLAGADDNWICDFVTAVGEAVANAVTHGSPKSDPGYVIFCLRPQHSFVTAEVTDFGPGIWGWTGHPQMPPPSSLRGRGLGMMQVFCDDVEVQTGHGGTLVRLTKASAW
ncbi:MAG: ATP-binding protein [Armatimonadota bacterium]|nr:ATP-binding protein [Armatimonadota bacterium]